jgi:hypothetical protein
MDEKPAKWRCPPCIERRLNKTNTPIEKKEKMSHYARQMQLQPVFDGEHDNDCYICFIGGDLICCDYCEKAFHMRCHIPPLVNVPAGLWKCCECSASDYSKMFKCGECEACVRDDCGECNPCLDKVKFGGAGRRKKACLKKQCPFKRLAPPASKIASTTTEEELQLQFKKALDARSADRKQRRTRLEASVSPNVNGNNTTNGNGMTGEKVSNGDISSSKNKRKRAEDVNISDRKAALIASWGASESTSAVTASGETPSRKANDKSTKKTTKTDTSPNVTESKAKKRAPQPKRVDLNDNTSNTIKAIVKRAADELDNENVQVEACQYLRIFVTSVENVEKIAQLGALKMIALAMIEHTNDARIQIETITTLSELVYTNQAFSSPMFQHGCPSLVLEAMRNHESQLQVQHAGCGFFRALSYNFINHITVNSVCGVEAVIQSMKYNSKCCEVLKDGCLFLQNMLCNPAVSAETTNAIISHNLVDFIIDGMVSFTEPDYLAAACGILARIAVEEDARAAIIADDKVAIRALVSVLSSNIDAIACASCLTALNLLADDSATEIVQCGGIQNIISYVTTRTDSLEMLVSAFRLLVKLSTADGSSQIFKEAGGFDMIKAGMNKHRHVPFIKERGCALLRKLEISNEDEATAAVTMIVAAINCDKEDDMVQFEGGHALLQLCSTFPDLMSQLQSVKLSNAIFRETPVATDDINPVVTDPYSSSVDIAEEEEEAMYKPNRHEDPVGSKIKAIISKANRNLSESKIQDLACEKLRGLSVDEENVDKIVLLGGLRMVAAAMKEHPDKTSKCNLGDTARDSR